MLKFLTGLSSFRALVLGFVLAVAAIVTPTPADAMTLAEAQAVVSATNCTADVAFIDSYTFNAYYSPGEHVIVMLSPDRMPELWQRHVLLHETGHCLQFQTGDWQALRAAGPHELEWDADRFALRKMAELYGVDAAALNHEIWAWVYNTFGQTGDDYDSHGILTHRITRGWLNRSLTPLEAP